MFKENRVISFLLLFIVYVLAGAIGILTYFALPFSFPINLLIADVVATIVTFTFSVILGNASVYDPYWSVQPIVIVLVAGFVNGFNLPSIFFTIAICVWGIRLTANWAYTFQNLTCQDWRYTMLHDTTGIFYPVINFVGIHLVPTLVVYLCTLPAVYVFREGTFSVWTVVFFVLSLCAVLLQGTADFQMHSFRKNRTSKFIRVGLWKHSRHPNYLGEITMWWTIGISAVISTGIWWLVAGAIANHLLFLCVSIPLADGRQSKKEGFDEYKKETRMLLPIPKF